MGGRGLKAVKEIPRGTPIICEKELPEVVNGTVGVIQARDPLFQALFCPPNNPTPQGRFEANRFQMGKDTKGRQKEGIFEQASRLNHSCVPNAYFAWNYRSRRLTVHAIVDIPKDAEIFVNYCADEYLMDRQQRQQELVSYQFNCTCQACQLNTNFGMASAQRRQEMQTLDTRIDNNANNTLPVERSQQLIDIKAFSLLLQQEGLFYPQLADVYQLEVSWYIREIEKFADGTGSTRYRMGLLEEALEVARKQLEWDVACTGHNSPEVKKTLRTLKVICGLGQ